MPLWRPWKRLRYSVAFLPWSLPVKLTIRNPRPQKTKEKFGTSKTFMEEDQIRENVTKLKVCKIMGPERLPPQVLRELADIIASPLSNIFETSEQLGEKTEREQMSLL